MGLVDVWRSECQSTGLVILEDGKNHLPTRNGNKIQDQTSSKDLRTKYLPIKAKEGVQQTESKLNDNKSKTGNSSKNGYKEE
jgi:hypothetical protein